MFQLLIRRFSDGENVVYNVSVRNQVFPFLAFAG